MKRLTCKTLWLMSGNTGVISNGDNRWLDNGLVGTFSASSNTIPATAWYLVDTQNADVLQLQLAVKVTGGAVGGANDSVTTCRAVGLAVGIPVSQNAAQTAGEERFNRPAVSRGAYAALASTQHRGTKMAVVVPDPAIGGYVSNAAAYESFCQVNGFFKEGAIPASGDFIDWFCTIGQRANNSNSGSMGTNANYLQTPIGISGIGMVALAVRIQFVTVGVAGLNFPVLASLQASTFALTPDRARPGRFAAA